MAVVRWSYQGLAVRVVRVEVAPERLNTRMSPHVLSSENSDPPAGETRRIVSSCGRSIS
jgi:hypothetical protein